LPRSRRGSLGRVRTRAPRRLPCTTVAHDHLGVIRPAVEHLQLALTGHRCLGSQPASAGRALHREARATDSCRPRRPRLPRAGEPSSICGCEGPPNESAPLRASPVCQLPSGSTA
jgi:hypothetical protein